MRAVVPVTARTVVATFVAVALAAAGPAAASPARQPVRTRPAATTRLTDSLTAVAATSASDAWAVGTYEANGWKQTLIEHWDGTSWTVTPSANPGGPAVNNFLYGVAATSPSDAWAVGAYRKGTYWRTLIEHWNGTAWRQVRSPSPGVPSTSTHFPSTALFSVTATVPSDAWAVGTYRRRNTNLTLIEHWNGTSWQVVPSPNAGGLTTYNELHGVAALSLASVWAVGASGGSSGKTLIEHWNGTTWKLVRSPSPPVARLDSVSVTSRTSAWAIGTADGFKVGIAERWDGKSWQEVTVPAPGGKGYYAPLYGVAATTSRAAWAAGYSTLTSDALIERWDGSSWQRAVTPRCSSSGYGSLTAVAASSASDAWAVGTCWTAAGGQTLIEHWNGSTWQLVPSPSE